jgi:hypothetical protein
MKKTFLSSLVLLAVSSTIAYAGNTAVSNQTGSYAASASVSQTGDLNQAYTDQVANNASAVDSTTVTQNGTNNFASSYQEGYDYDGDATGNVDTINQTGDANSATVLTIGDNNTTDINQNSGSDVATAYTSGYDNQTVINQSGDNLFGNNEAYSVIDGDSSYNTVSINQGQTSFSSNNTASSYVTGYSLGTDVAINQNGDNGQAYVYADYSWGSDVSINQNNVEYGSGNYASAYLYDADGSVVAINQSGDLNSADAALINADYNSVAIDQAGTSNYAGAYLDNAYGNSVGITQTGTGNSAYASIVGASFGNIAINQAN